MPAEFLFAKYEQDNGYVQQKEREKISFGKIAQGAQQSCQQIFFAAANKVIT